jgi:hypothetical protein
MQKAAMMTIQVIMAALLLSKKSSPFAGERLFSWNFACWLNNLMISLEEINFS